jgi:hypothetical protein
MKNKRIILSALLIVSINVLNAQTTESTFITTNSITIPSGEKWELLSVETSNIYYTSYDIITPGLQIQVGNDVVEYAVGLSTKVAASNNSRYNVALSGGDVLRTWVWSGDDGYLPVSGPATLRIVNSQGGSNPSAFLTYRKYTLAKSDAYISFTSVVIPTSAAGDVDVKMEQSADNVTWTECLPGTYNSSTVKRFFRLRAVEK